MHGLQFIKQTIRSLKRQYGLPVTIIRITDTGTNVSTGQRTFTTISHQIKRVIWLPDRQERQFVYDLDYIARNKDFTTGMDFEKNERRLLIDANDLNGFDVLVDDLYIFGSDQWQVKTRRLFPEYRAFEIRVRSLSGQELFSPFSPSIIDPLELNQDIIVEKILQKFGSDDLVLSEVVRLNIVRNLIVPQSLSLIQTAEEVKFISINSDSNISFGQDIELDGFQVISFWDTYNPDANGLGTDPVGFSGTCYDGRYIYFAPNLNSISQRHGEVMRYDTQASFNVLGSWEAFDPGANGVGTDPDGYSGCVFDGQYVCFAPVFNGTAFHDEVLRYDTLLPFGIAGSWQAFKPNKTAGGVQARGFQGLAICNNKLYFAPNQNPSGPHGAVLQYDPAFGNFTSPAAWFAFNAGGIGPNTQGFVGAICDGVFVYFVPFNNGTWTGEILRYDTTGVFSNPGSWTSFDPNANGVGSNPVGYAGAIFDGRYIYFCPYRRNSGWHAEVLRYDTQGTFTVAGSWSTYNPFANGVGNNPEGFFGGTFDGQYIYFSPYNRNTYHGEVLRYDTTQNFFNAANWDTFESIPGVDPEGYRGISNDGKFLYFGPYNNNTTYHGEVVRFRVHETASIPSTILGGSTF